MRRRVSGSNSPRTSARSGRRGLQSANNTRSGCHDPTGRLIFRVFRLPASRQPGLSLGQQSINLSHKLQQLLRVSFDRGLTAQFSPTLRNRRWRVLSLRNGRLGIRDFRVRTLRLIVHSRLDAPAHDHPPLERPEYCLRCARECRWDKPCRTNDDRRQASKNFARRPLWTAT